MEWQPIETAPRDYTDILVVNDRGQAVVFWEKVDEKWIVQDHKHCDRPLRGSEPTHWMPLPEPPKD
jgi:hypothetical protein